MTCNCIEKIAAAIREDKAEYPHAEGVAILNRIADRLSPAPAETQEPLTGWRAKCKIEPGGQHPCRVIYTQTPTGASALVLHPDGEWLVSEGYAGYKWMKRGEAWFPTESAARAALLAASEPPGCEEDKQPPAPFGCPSYYESAHDVSHCGFCRGRVRVWNGTEWVPPPAPASTPAFDAVAEAEKMVRGVYKSHNSGYLVQFVHRGIVVSALDGGVDSSASTIQEAIAAALTAAHAAGRAEGDAAGYARGKAEIDRLRSGLENFAADPHPYISRRARAILDAAPDAKEAGR